MLSFIIIVLLLLLFLLFAMKNARLGFLSQYFDTSFHFLYTHKTQMDKQQQKSFSHCMQSENNTKKSNICTLQWNPSRGKCHRIKLPETHAHKINALIIYEVQLLFNDVPYWVKPAFPIFKWFYLFLIKYCVAYVKHFARDCLYLILLLRMQTV